MKKNHTKFRNVPLHMEKVQTIQTKFTLGAVYIHPNVPQEAIEYFMFQMPGAYSTAIRLILPNMNPNAETPILLCGDFNVDIMQNRSFVSFMKSKFNFDCISSASASLGNTCIDLTFTRNISIQTLPYVSYFRIIDLYSTD
jgi:hypothetical protein